MSTRTLRSGHDRRISMIYEPDGFANTSAQLMGRQVAGHSFLAALLADGTEVACVTPNDRTREHFAAFAGAHGEKRQVAAFPANHHDALAARGLLFTPDPTLEKYAFSRLRHRPSAYSLCGVTHTTATHAMLDKIKTLPLAPVMPWDALICTSTSVRSTIAAVHEAQADYLKWRLGSKSLPAMCELPVIPLGINTGRFNYTPAFSAAARRELGIEADEVVLLFVGRLSPYTKANPWPMYLAASHAAKVTGKKVTLIECGWFESPQIGEHMEELRSLGLEGVKYLHHDGREPAEADKCWAAADIFLSLSDNIQETFGLTPIEAMAAGLPVIVSDWDGYKETVPDGLAGFRVPTRFPESTGTLAAEFETHLVYQRYCLRAASVTSLDLGVVNDRLVRLVADPGLRRQMGSAGRDHARTTFDWSVVLPQYYALWDELASRRASATDEAVPACDPARQAPEQVFASYPTGFLTPDSLLHWGTSFPEDRYEAVRKSTCFQNATVPLPALDRLISAKAQLLEPQGMSCRALGDYCGLGDDYLLQIAAVMKIGLITV